MVFVTSPISHNVSPNSYFDYTDQLAVSSFSYHFMGSEARSVSFDLFRF